MQHQTVPQNYRVTFDQMSGVAPVIVPVPASVTEIAEQVNAAFDEAVEIDVKVRVDLATGGVTVANEDGDIFERGRIEGPGIPEQPKPDYWLSLADDLRTAADRIATLAGTDTRPVSVTLNVLGSVLARDAERMVPLVDALATAFDTTAASSREHRDQHRARAEVGAVEFQAYTFVPKLEDPEKAAMRAELDALRAQLAEGGAAR